ncbi:MAG: exonuclease domain-containing protein [Christensenellales bacterium]
MSKKFILVAGQRKVAVRYLFFDIECANCFNGHGKICSFGYVITDTNFEIIEQKDILINPKTKFHLKNRRKEGEDIELSYPLDMFLASPDFDYYYPTIKNLLTYLDQLVFGHSVINDIHFVLSECKRYNKPTFGYNAYDTQVLYKLLHKEKNESSLSKLCEKYGIEVTDLHRSDYDAYLTMSVMKKLCEEFDTNLDGIFGKLPNAFYTVKDDGNIVNNFVVESSSKKILDVARKIKIDRRLPKNEKVKEKYFCLSKDIEDNHFGKAMFLAQEIRRRGGFYCSKVGKSDYFVQGEQECDRSKMAKKLASQPDSRLKVLQQQELLDMLGIDVKTFESIADDE